MSVKKIVKVWHNGLIISDNIKFLQEKTKNVFFPLTESSNSIINDLIDTYKKTPCAGIAANQIGYEYQIFIGMKELADIENQKDIEKAEAELTDANGNPHGDNYEVYINPQIDKFDKKSINQDEEGCLSIPGLLVDRERYDIIKIRYYNISGQVKKITMSGFLSKLFQHEIDHLNGILMIDEIDKLDNVSPSEVTKENIKKYTSLYSQYCNINNSQ